MQELPLDATVANRFIASLSKSLQALCHGCMDFDNGIEIVGFINVNIDSGSKVDYVLNEKVQRCANNSMTFVSNSFLAKKESPKKHTRDGACSPVQELCALPSSQQMQQQPYQHPHQQQPSYPYSSSNSQALPGAQKRPWSDGGRSQGRGMPRKQPRGGGGRGYSTAAGYGSPARVTQKSEICFTPAKAPSGSSDISGVDVKKEAFESGHCGNTSNDACNDNNAGAEKSECTFDVKLNIKPDPESVHNPDEDLPDDNQKDNFLNDPSDLNYQQEIPEHSEDTDNINPSTRSTDNTYPEQLDHSEAGSSNAHQPNRVSVPPPQFDDSQSYPQSSFSGQEGERASGDASGFDVIEIDEEDEDMQVMFGDNPVSSNPSALPQTTAGVQCMFCPSTFDKSSLRCHMAKAHGHQMPLACSVCGKGFMTESGMNRHMITHQRKFTCPVCDLTVSQKSTIKSHMKAKHKSAQCGSCQEIISLVDGGYNYSRHLLSHDTR